MKLSARTRYASRLLLELARYGGNGPISAARLSELTDVSVQFIEQILKLLKQHGLTASVRGVAGGHSLARSPDAITLGIVVDLLEGGIALAPCCGKRAADCPRKADCLIRHAWRRVSLQAEQELDGISLRHLLLWETRAKRACSGCWEKSFSGCGDGSPVFTGPKQRGRSIFPYSHVITRTGRRQRKSSSLP